MDFEITIDDPKVFTRPFTVAGAIGNGIHVDRDPDWL
jgi:hypothetical protein